MIGVLLFGLYGGSVTTFASEPLEKTDYLIIFQDTINREIIEMKGEK